MTVKRGTESCGGDALRRAERAATVSPAETLGDAVESIVLWAGLMLRVEGVAAAKCFVCDVDIFFRIWQKMKEWAGTQMSPTKRVYEVFTLCRD